MRRVAASFVLVLAAVVAPALIGVMPASAAGTTVSLSAASSDVNLVTVTWSTSNPPSGAAAYLYDFTDETNAIIGVKPLSGSATLRGVPGVTRFGMDIQDSSGTTVASTRYTLTLTPPPNPPTITSANPAFVDRLSPSTPAPLTWTKDSGVTTEISGGQNGSAVPATTVDLDDSTATSGSYTPPANTYAPAPGQGSVTTNWNVKECFKSSTGSRLCNAGTLYTIVDGTARVTTGARVVVQPGQTLPISWTQSPSGEYYWLTTSSSGLTIPNASTAGTSENVTVAANATGVINVNLLECNLIKHICGNGYHPVAPVSGTITMIEATGTPVGPNQNAFVAPNGPLVAQVTQANGQVVDVTTTPVMGNDYGTIASVDTNPATGQPFKVNDTITAGTSLLLVTTNDVLSGADEHSDNVQLVVGDPNQPWTTVAFDDPASPYTFNAAGDRWPVGDDHLLGLPMVVQPTSGSAFSVGEFSGSVGELSDNASGTAVVTPHDVPLLRKTASGSTLRTQVAPFQQFLLGGVHQMPTSQYTEDVIQDQSGKIWFGQGGGLGSFTTNHSRIVRFDPSVTPDPNAINDPAVCAYNLPASSTPNGTNVFNNTIFAMTAVHDAATNKDRIYFVESRGDGTSNLTWFVPSEFPTCGPATNLFDFSTSANPTPPYCASEGDTGCFHATPLTDPAATVQTFLGPVTQAVNASWAAYPVNDGTSTWIGTFRSGRLFKVTGSAVTSYPLHKVNRPERQTALPGVTTAIASDANYIYVLDATDASVSRFAKTPPQGADCTVLDANGNNPCEQVIYLPLASNTENGYWLNLSGNQLWFSVGNVNSTVDLYSGYVGVINTDTWVPGNLYTGLDRTARSQDRSASGSSFGVIPVSNGDLYLPDYSRGEIVRLRRKTS
jgi:hypothetical protein